RRSSGSSRLVRAQARRYGGRRLLAAPADHNAKLAYHLSREARSVRTVEIVPAATSRALGDTGPGGRPAGPARPSSRAVHRTDPQRTVSRPKSDGGAAAPSAGPPDVFYTPHEPGAAATGSASIVCDDRSATTPGYGVDGQRFRPLRPEARLPWPGQSRFGR